MDYKEKYKEALERAKKEWVENLDNCYTNYRERLEIIFPELKESEDERIRKDIIWCIEHSGIKSHKPINPHATTTVKEALTWLEKQGVQKSIEPLKLSDIDKAMVESRIVEDLLIMRACEWLRYKLPLTNLDKFINEFKKAMKVD